MKLSTQQAQRFRGQLEVLRAQRLDVQHTNENEPLDKLSLETTDEISHIRAHTPDLRMDVRRVRDIDDALIKLENGTFGSCSNCGREIPLARLEALPYTRFCALCESQLEQRRRECLN